MQLEPYLESEEGRSPATVKEYLKDVRLLRAWLDAPDQPQPRRNHRLVSAWRSFWKFLRDVQKIPGVQLGPAELKLPKRLPGALPLAEIAKLLDTVY